MSDRWTVLNDLAASYNRATEGWLFVSTLGDVDGDGGADVAVVIDAGVRPRRLYFALSSANFLASVHGSTWYASLTGLGDIDGDGISDVLLHQRSQGPTHLEPDPPRPSRVNVRPPSSTLTPLPTCLDSPPVPTPARVDVRDVDADGLADLTLFDRTDHPAQRYFGGPVGFSADRCEELP